LDIQRISIHTDHKDIVWLSHFKHQIADLCAGDNNNTLLNKITKRIRKTSYYLSWTSYPPTEQDKGLKDSPQVAEEEICNCRENLQATCR
jgi:hypothetical protein